MAQRKNSYQLCSNDLSDSYVKEEVNSNGENGCKKQDLNSKRDDYLSWDDYFMAVAFLSAQRSKDPSTQVGACVVDDRKLIVGIGYNGMPIGCSDDKLPWSRIGKTFCDTKYAYVCHAELNAILNKNSTSVRGCSIYVALFPCNECAKVIVQSGIKYIVYYSDKYAHTPEVKASKIMFDMAGISYRQHIPAKQKIVIDFSVVETNKPKPTGMKKYKFSGDVDEDAVDVDVQK